MGGLSTKRLFEASRSQPRGHDDAVCPLASRARRRYRLPNKRLVNLGGVGSMALTTPLSERIGIEHPFMQAGMGGIGPITLARLAAAISEAGALGTLAQPALVLEKGADIEAEELEAEVGRVVEQVRQGIRLAVSLTDKPLAINVRIAQEQPDAPHVVRAILEERERDPKVRAQLKVLTTSGGHPRMYGLNQ